MSSDTKLTGEGQKTNPNPAPEPAQTTAPVPAQTSAPAPAPASEPAPTPAPAPGASTSSPAKEKPAVALKLPKEASSQEPKVKRVSPKDNVSFHIINSLAWIQNTRRRRKKRKRKIRMER